MIYLEWLRIYPVDLPMRGSFASARDRIDHRRLLLIELVDRNGSSGWGEVDAFEHPTYTEETLNTARALIEHEIPALLSGSANEPEEIARTLTPIRGNPMAKAAVEMAAFDLAARSAGVPLSALIGGNPSRRAIPSGVALGIDRDLDRLQRAAVQAIAEGASRIKLKIQPSWDLEPLSALRDAVGPGFPLVADANSAYEADTAGNLSRLDTFGLAMIEQPLEPLDLVGHRRLQDTLETPICLDESIRTVHDVATCLALGLRPVINLKPGRVGGYAKSLEILSLSQREGLDLWIGGMLESSLGRAHLLHLSTNPGVTLTGDVSDPGRYLATDVCLPLQAADGGGLAVPTAFGIGVEPERERLPRPTEIRLH